MSQSPIRLRFVFVGEGPSDAALVSPLEALCIACGADEASGIAPSFSRLGKPVPKAVGERIRMALTLEPGANLIMAHRDADGRDPAPHRAEIADAFDDLDGAAIGVPVVPVQATEAWLLANSAAIRRAADNPQGTVALGLPAPQRAEEIADPKSRLFEALMTASELRGRRRQRFKKKLEQRRRLLLERLDQTTVSSLASWQRLTEDLTRAIETMKETGRASTTV